MKMILPFSTLKRLFIFRIISVFASIIIVFSFTCHSIYAAEIPSVKWQYVIPAGTNNWDAVETLNVSGVSSSFDTASYEKIIVDYRIYGTPDPVGGAVYGVGIIKGYVKSYSDGSILAQDKNDTHVYKGSLVFDVSSVTEEAYLCINGSITGYRIYPGFTAAISDVREQTEESIVPTENPKQEEDANPTQQPTGTPTQQPTKTPADEPTGTPTLQPTKTPADEPTGTPTLQPTKTPADEPTGTPTLQPTKTPTVAPTNTPTSVPTDEQDNNGLMILSQPLNVTSATDRSTGFSVAGTGITGYQWLKSSDGVRYTPITALNCKSSDGVLFTGYNSSILLLERIRSSQNGTLYKCKVSDSSGKVLESNAAKLTVVDRTAPLIVVSLSPSGNTEGMVTASVEAYDQDTGLHERAYSYDGGASFLADVRTQLIDKNGTYSVVVRDKQNNASVASYTVSNIILGSNKNNDSQSDSSGNSSNTSSNPNSDNSSNKDSSAAEKLQSSVPSSSTTPSGNQNKNAVSKSDKKTSEEKESSSEKNKASENKKLNQTKNMIDKSTVSNSSSARSDNNRDKAKEVKEEKKDNEISLSAEDYSGYVQVTLEENKGLSNWQLGLIMGGIILAVVLILLLLFFTAVIQCEDDYEDEYGDIRRMYDAGSKRTGSIKYKFAAFAFIRRKDGRFRIRLSEELYDQGSIRICFFILFAFAMEGKTIEILIGDSDQNEIVQRKTEKIKKYIVLN